MQTDKGDAITQFGGNVQVSLPYTLKDGENPNAIQEMAAVLANIIYYRDVVVGDAVLSNFTDLGGVSAANLTAIQTAIGAGLLSAEGMGGGIFDPNGLTTRGQATQIQINLLKVLGQLY